MTDDMPTLTRAPGSRLVHLLADSDRTACGLTLGWGWDRSERPTARPLCRRCRFRQQQAAR